MFPGSDIELLDVACLISNLSSLILDFVSRLKVGGINFNFFIYEQLPTLRPEAYSEGGSLFIVPRVVELTYTSRSLTIFANDMGYEGPPFTFNPERRAVLRAELDAWYAHAYGLTRDELRYVLDPADVMGNDYPSETFRGLKEKELRRHGEYRTRRLVLAAYDELANDLAAVGLERPLAGVA